MDIHHLKIFAVVYKNRSFSRASEELHISQPTISEHMKNLENELGFKLFDRLGRTIIPTKEAEILYPKSLQIIEDLDRLKDHLSRAGKDIKGHLVIGASTIPGTYILPMMLSEFRKENPKVSFEILIEDSRKITDMVLTHELMLGVVGAVMETRKLEYVPFVEDELVLAASGKIIDSSVIGIKQLHTIPFVIREEGSGTRRTMERIMMKNNIDIKNLNITAVLGSTDSVKQAIKSGLGASILSRIAILDEVKRGSLKEIKIKGLTMKRNFHIITHRKRTLPNPYSAFYQYIHKSGR